MGDVSKKKGEVEAGHQRGKKKKREERLRSRKEAVLGSQLSREAGGFRREEKKGKKGYPQAE